ncbi:HEAT repeat domain-containing protein [Elusimicrobiota bacterium]
MQTRASPAVLKAIMRHGRSLFFHNRWGSLRQTILGHKPTYVDAGTLIAAGVLLLTIFPNWAWGDPVYISPEQIARRHSFAQLLALVALMVVNYLANAAVIGAPACLFGKVRPLRAAKDLMIFTLLAQGADWIGMTLGYVAAKPATAILNYLLKFTSPVERTVYHATTFGLKFILTGMALGGLVYFFAKKRWGIPNRVFILIALVAVILTNPAIYLYAIKEVALSRDWKRAPRAVHLLDALRAHEELAEVAEGAQLDGVRKRALDYLALASPRIATPLLLDILPHTVKGGDVVEALGKRWAAPRKPRFAYRRLPREKPVPDDVKKAVLDALKSNDKGLIAGGVKAAAEIVLEEALPELERHGNNGFHVGEALHTYDSQAASKVAARLLKAQFDRPFGYARLITVIMERPVPDAIPGLRDLLWHRDPAMNGLRVCDWAMRGLDRCLPDGPGFSTPTFWPFDNAEKNRLMDFLGKAWAAYLAARSNPTLANKRESVSRLYEVADAWKDAKTHIHNSPTFKWAKQMEEVDGEHGQIATGAQIRNLRIILTAAEIRRYVEATKFTIKKRGKAPATPWNYPGHTPPEKARLVGGELLDLWGNPYQYDPSPSHGAQFAIYSFGPNGKDEKGQGDDIASWRQQHKEPEQDSAKDVLTAAVDKKDYLRDDLVRSIDRHEGEFFTKLLIRVLREGASAKQDPRVRGRPYPCASGEAADAILNRMGEKAIPLIEEVMENPGANPLVRESLKQRLGNWYFNKKQRYYHSPQLRRAYKAQGQEAVNLLDDPNGEVRFQALQRLQRNPDSIPFAKLTALLDDGGNAGPLAAKLLGSSKNPKAPDALLAALKSARTPIRVWAMISLGKLREGRAYPALIEGLTDDHGDIRSAAAKGLAGLGDQRAVPALIKAIRRKNHRYDTGVDSAITALAELGTDRAVPPLIEGLKSEHMGFRRAAAKSLGNLRAKSAVGPLIRTLKDENQQVRLQAIWALGEIGAPAAIAPLEGLQESDSSNQGPIRYALKRLRARQAQ